MMAYSCPVRIIWVKKNNYRTIGKSTTKKKEIAGARKQEFRMFLNEFWHKLTHV